MNEAKRYSWDEIPVDHPMELLDRRRIMGQNMTVAQVLLHQGLFVGTHQHPNEQVAMVMFGRVEFEVGNPGGNEMIVLGPGEVLHLPPDVPHSARALEDSLVLDVFSPAAEKTGVDSD